jgi:hypothetical protein
MGTGSESFMRCLSPFSTAPFRRCVARCPSPFFNRPPWHEPRVDRDNDGRLSPAEFQRAGPPELACLVSEYFRCLDVNGDGRLDLTEFFFQSNAAMSP